VKMNEAQQLSADYISKVYPLAEFECYSVSPTTTVVMCSFLVDNLPVKLIISDRGYVYNIKVKTHTCTTTRKIVADVKENLGDLM